MNPYQNKLVRRLTILAIFMIILIVGCTNKYKKDSLYCEKDSDCRIKPGCILPCDEFNQDKSFNCSRLEVCLIYVTI